MGIFQDIRGMFKWVAGARDLATPIPINWEMPSKEILGSKSDAPDLTAPVKSVALELQLSKFGFECKVVGNESGPSSTLYEIEPKGVSTIKMLSQILPDVGLRLGVHGIKSLGHLPGSSYIGVEIEHGETPTITMPLILNSIGQSHIPVPIGVKPNGKALSIDLAEAPHMLVAGSTGTGKSVFINSLIASSLALRNPDQVQFVLIDPKLVEFQRYRGIPHLLFDVLTEVDAAVEALHILERFMDDRFKELADAGVQDINAYNSDLDSRNSTEARLNRIVVVIDEFADLIMQNKHVEQPVVRIAQKARAAGLHLVIGTQRPVVKVVTGLIKANIPTRVSFRVPSAVDSRVVLDEKGAERLGGPGDLLVKGCGFFHAIRAQAPYMDSSVVDRLVEHWRPQDRFLKRY